jgi:hypothetical protein
MPQEIDRMPLRPGNYFRANNRRAPRRAHVYIQFALIIFSIMLSGCSTLSKKARQQNIRYAASRDLIEGMEMVREPVRAASTQAIKQYSIESANTAAKEGWQDITVLVEYISQIAETTIVSTWVPGQTHTTPGRTVYNASGGSYYVPGSSYTTPGYMQSTPVTIVIYTYDISYWQ